MKDRSEYILTLFVIIFFALSSSAGFAQVSLHEKKSIALVLSTLDDPFFRALKKQVERKAEELEYDVMIFDSQNNSEKEFINVKKAINKGAQILLIDPNDSEDVGLSVELANQKNIPVITLDRASNKGSVVCHITSNNVGGGEMAGKFIAEKLGNTAKVIQLEGSVGLSVAQERGEGFKRAIKNTGISLLASCPANFDQSTAMNIMESLLKKYPFVQAIFAQNDAMALGAARAIKKLGIKNEVSIVGFDGRKEAIEAIHNNVLTATIVQQPEIIASIAMDTAKKVLENQPVAKKILVDLKLIEK